MKSQPALRAGALEDAQAVPLLVFVVLQLEEQEEQQEGRLVLLAQALVC
jgi:hypothetical protein